jgi:hypothetical protein
LFVGVPLGQYGVFALPVGDLTQALLPALHEYPAPIATDGQASSFFVTALASRLLRQTPLTIGKLLGVQVMISALKITSLLIHLPCALSAVGLKPAVVQ